jgi:hypothetical protein
MTLTLISLNLPLVPLLSFLLFKTVMESFPAAGKYKTKGREEGREGGR